MQDLCLCSHTHVIYHVKLVEFRWVDKTLIPSGPSCLSSTISSNVLHSAALRSQMCVSDPAEHTEHPASAVVTWVGRSGCVHHEKCIGFFFEHILHLGGSSHLASQDSMMPFAPPCVCESVCDNYSWRTMRAFCIILSPPQVFGDPPL